MRTNTPISDYYQFKTKLHSNPDPTGMSLEDKRDKKNQLSKIDLSDRKSKNL